MSWSRFGMWFYLDKIFFLSFVKFSNFQYFTFFFETVKKKHQNLIILYIFIYQYTAYLTKKLNNIQKHRLILS